MATTVFRTCSLCEATCGLAFEVEDNRILSVRPDDDDVFSHGYVCPKGIAIADIHTTPTGCAGRCAARGADGFEPISLGRRRSTSSRAASATIRARHGADAIGFYWGNPTGNNHGALLMRGGVPRRRSARATASAPGSQDASPRFATSY